MRARVLILVENHSGYRQGLVGVHGFSAILDVEDNVILIDTGPNADVLLNNMETLGYDPKDIDYVVLTHGHYDHTGGLKGLIEARKRETIVIAHPDVFSDKFSIKGRIRYIGIPFSREKLISLGAKFLLTKSSFKITEGVMFSGEIPREYWTRTTGHVVVNGNLVEDPLLDDISVILELERGLVVISGCGHSGLKNIVTHAKRLGNKPVMAIVGGYHLIDSKEDILSDVVKFIGDEGIEKAFLGHCTGIKEIAWLKKHLNDVVEFIYAGRTMEFD